MIPLLIAAALASPNPATAPTSAQEQRFANCVALIDSDPAKAIAAAGVWRIEGGGALARQCLGLAYAAQGRWLPAATAFEQAAQQAEKDRDGRAGYLWAQTGNAALAGGDAAKARSAFDAALASGAVKDAEAGEVHLDRARAFVALRDTKSARIDIDDALKLIPSDPLGWLLSATLARRTGDLDRAQTDIGEALKRSPDDAAVALEAGNIAAMAGAPDAARMAWEAAVKNAPNSDAGKAAASALKQFGAAAKP
jgi:tetratricopeptide (TPR) repeat protein